APRQGVRAQRVRALPARPRRDSVPREPRLGERRASRLRRNAVAEPPVVWSPHAPPILHALADARRATLSRVVSLASGVALLVALDALVIVVARAVDPGAPVIFISNLAAVFIGAIQLLYGVPLA